MSFEDASTLLTILAGIGLGLLLIGVMLFINEPFGD